MNQSIADPCVFIGHIDNQKIILLLFVDDGLILSATKSVLNAFIDKLSATFRITYGNSNYCVGLELIRDRVTKSINICQQTYI